MKDTITEYCNVADHHADFVITFIYFEGLGANLGNTFNGWKSTRAQCCENEQCRYYGTTQCTNETKRILNDAEYSD